MGRRRLGQWRWAITRAGAERSMVPERERSWREGEEENVTVRNRAVKRTWRFDTYHHSGVMI